MAGQVVVTGGAGCIGLVICRRLRTAGLTAVALDLPAAIAAVDWDSPANGGIAAVPGDPVAGLVICAGILRDTFLGRISDDQMDLMFQVNVAGMARVTDVFAPLL